MTEPSETSKDLKDLQSYPILTEEIDVDYGSSRGSGSGSPADIGRLVEGSVRNALGWRPRLTDVNGLRAALDNAFSEVEVAGNQRWVWRPPTAIRTEQGTVTGAQASFASHVNAALDQCLPILDRLTSLTPTSDAEDVEATRAIIEGSLREIAQEVNDISGIRIQRVNQQFDLLLGPTPKSTNPDKVNGQLGELRTRLGLIRQRVGNIPEEQVVTDYWFLASNVISLYQIWGNLGDFFERGSDQVFLGTQLVLLERTLTVISESIAETELLMKSVLLDENEREVVELPTTPPITIAQLFSWAQDVCNDKGRYLIREGGKDGVIALGSILNELHGLFQAARKLAEGGSSSGLTIGRIPQGYFSNRVRRGLEQIELHVGESAALAGKITRDTGPKLNKVDVHPAQANQVSLTVHGSGIQDGAQVVLSPGKKNNGSGVTGEAVTVLSDQKLIAFFDLSGFGFKNNWPKSWSLSVINPDGGRGFIEFQLPDITGGGEPETKPEALRINAVTQTGKNPMQKTLEFTLLCSGLVKGTTVQFIPDIGWRKDPLFDFSQGKVTVFVPVPDFPGPVWVLLRGPDGQQDTEYLFTHQYQSEKSD